MTIFAKIHLHPILLLFILLSLITGTFIQLFIILFIVLFHELGHYLAAAYFKWRIQYIMLWVFGGVMKTDETTEPAIKEEIIVTLAGPLQHGILFIILHIMSFSNAIPESIIEQIHYYNLVILLFNLLPIYPLDGGKIVLLLQSSIRPYYTALKSTYLLSILFCCILFWMQFGIFMFTWSAFVLCLFLLLENLRARKEIYYTFIRFLFIRFNQKEKRRIHINYIEGNTFLMDVLKRLRRNRSHHFYVYNQMNVQEKATEQDCLQTYFIDYHITATMAEVIHKKKIE